MKLKYPVPAVREQGIETGFFGFQIVRTGTTTKKNGQGRLLMNYTNLVI